MRRKIFAVLLVLTTLLCGCSRNAIESQTDSTESTAEITAETLESESSLFSSESNQTEAPKESTALETEKAQPTMPETLPDVPEQTVSQVQTAPSATESPAEETRKPVAPEKPQEIPKPAETEPQPAPEAPEETKPKSAYDFEFDMEAIKADCIDIGKGMGLHLDTSLTPSNATWWNPVTAFLRICTIPLSRADLPRNAITGFCRRWQTIIPFRALRQETRARQTPIR